jgi:type IV pilus assembly protein PilQ
MNKNAWTMQAGMQQGTWAWASARVVIGTAWLAASLSTSLWAQVPNAIESVTGSVQGGSEVIRIDLTEALTAVPTGFTIQTPARIALDFPGVSNSMGRSAVDLNPPMWCRQVKEPASF